MPPSLQYDGAYTLSWSASDSGPDQTQNRTQKTGPLLSNGKIGVIMSPEGRGPSDVYITGVVDATRVGTYDSNILPGVQCLGTARLFDLLLEPQLAAVGPATVSLAMDTGIATVNYDVRNPSTGAVWASVSHDLFAHRSLPYLAVQTVRITFTHNYLSDPSAPAPSVYHDVVAPLSSLTNAQFTTNTFDMPDLADPLAMLVCSAQTVADREVSVAAAVAYVFDGAVLRNGGHNLYRVGRNQAYNRLDFKRDAMQAGRTYKLHIVSAIASSYDLQSYSLAESVTRALLNLVPRTPLIIAAQSDPLQQTQQLEPQPPPPQQQQLEPQTADEFATGLRAAHVAAWMALWRGNVSIDAREGATPEQEARLLRLRRALRVALYHVYSATRATYGSAPELNAASLSFVDRDGSLLYDGDLFFAPLLMLVNPALARGLLHHRARSLQLARQVAESFGAQGARFPYSAPPAAGDGALSRALYWDTISPLSVFNTPLVAISAWNLYRTTRDLDWLRTMGYDIMCGVADWIVSAASRREPDGCFTLAGVQGPARRRATSNTFTNYLAATALRCTIEASYETGVPVKEVWLTVFSQLAVNDAVDEARPAVLRTDELSVRPTMVAEPLLLMCPYLDHLYFTSDPRRDYNSLDEALAFYLPPSGDAVRISEPDHPYNLAARALLSCRVAQSLPEDAARERIAGFEAAVYRFLDLYESDAAWGGLLRYASGSSLNNNNNNNDVTMSAILLTMLLMGPAGMRIQGGVTDTRHYYQDMQVTRYATARMPTGWKSMRVSGFGSTGYTARAMAGGVSTLSGYAGFVGYTSFAGAFSVLNNLSA